MCLEEMMGTVFLDKISLNALYRKDTCTDLLYAKSQTWYAQSFMIIIESLW